MKKIASETKSVLEEIESLRASLFKEFVFNEDAASNSSQTA